MASPLQNVPRYLDPTKTGAPEGSEPKEVWLQNIAIAIEVIMPALALIVCILRGYIRILTKNVGSDDWFILSAMVLSIAQAVGSILYIKIAYIGIHNYEIPPHDRVGPGIVSYINGIIYNPILALVKISVLVFLLKLATLKRGVKFAIWVLLVFTVGQLIAIFAVVIFQCDRIDFNWDPTIRGVRCINKQIFSLSTVGLNIVTDLATLAIPFSIFLGLRMAKRAKIALLVVFALGFLVSVVSIFRLYIFAKIYYSPKSPDPNFRITYVLSAVENNMAIIAASGPSLWPLARRWFPGFFSGLALSRGYQGDIPDIEAPDHSSKEAGSASDASLQASQSKRFLGFSWEVPSLARKGGPGNQSGQEFRAGTHPGVLTFHSAGSKRFGAGDVGTVRGRYP